MFDRENDSIVRVQGVSKKFSNKTLWNSLSFSASKSEVVALIGPSGSGKTTLLNCLGLLDRADAGEISVGRRDVNNLSSAQKRLLLRSYIGFLFQFHGLVDNWTVDRNLRVAQAYGSIPRREKATQRAQALDRLGLSGLAARRVHTLSGGEQQRVALARLSLRKLGLILVDEPTSALDEDNVQLVLETLRKMAEDGSAVIVSTHDPRVVEFADRTISV